LIKAPPECCAVARQPPAATALTAALAWYASTRPYAAPLLPSGDAQTTAPYFITAFFIHSVDTDFGRTMAEPMALLMIACAQIPIARDTLKSTV